jgi:hypothetical protein
MVVRCCFLIDLFKFKFNHFNINLTVLNEKLAVFYCYAFKKYEKY